MCEKDTQDVLIREKVAVGTKIHDMIQFISETEGNLVSLEVKSTCCLRPCMRWKVKRNLGRKALEYANSTVTGIVPETLEAV